MSNLNNPIMSSPPAYTIRPGTEDDLPGILEILNEQIATSTAIFTDDPLDIEDRCAWFRDLQKSGYPLYVAVPNPSPQSEGLSEPSSPSVDVLGFVAYGQFRSKPGYRFTVETSLYIHKDIRGGGVGSALLRKIIDHAREAGNVHVMVAGTAGNNIPSIRLHEKFGFENSITLKEVGYKFGEWQDVVFLTLKLPMDPSVADGTARK